MNRTRHGVVTRAILLLLAAAMPLCCCVVRSVAVPTTDDAPRIVSCCAGAVCGEQSDTESVPEESKSCASGCCIKAPATVDDWTPPCDDFGMPMDLVSWPTSLIAPLTASPITRLHHPPPGPWSVSAPSLRRAIMLQV